MARLDRLLAINRAPGRRRSPRLRSQYYAFLSYSHKDKELADWLHRELERFRVPRTLAGRLTGSGVVPTRLTPIFRDEQELPAAGDLGEEIKAALATSQFLIVLCSPTAATSRWTNAEIDSFKRTQPDACVLAAIAAGEPFASEMEGREAEECFPPALRQQYDRRGRPTAKRAEPLAADFRASGDGKRMALLKLVAGMLGVGLDDLVQRETTRRHRQLAWLAAGSLAGMAVTSTLAIAAVQSRDSARDQRREAEGLVGFMLGDLKDKLEPIGRLDALDAVGGRALAYYQHQDKGSLSDESLAQRAKALTLMGEIAQTRGDLDGALRRYQEALATTDESMRRHPDDPQRLFDHAQNEFWVGYIAYQRGHLDEAGARFREYRRLADQMVALAPDKKDYRLEQVYAETNLGTVQMEEDRYSEAAETFETAQRVSEALAASDPRNVQFQKQVTDNLAWLADAHEYSGSLQQALAERERQAALLSDFARTRPTDTQIQRDLMSAQEAVGRLLASHGDVAEGLKNILAASGIADSLFRIEPDNTEWLQASAVTKVELADIQLATGRVAEAAATTRSVCDVVDRLVSRNAGVSDWKARFRAACLDLRSRIALAQGNPSESLMLSRQSLAAARSSTKPLDRGMLSFTALAGIGNALAASGRKDDAAKAWTQALASIPKSIELRPSEQGAVAVVKLRLGDRRGMQQLVSSLSVMGYRHPHYVAALGQRPQG